MEKKIMNLSAVIAVMSLVIFGLTAYVYIDFSTDAAAAESLRLIERAEEDGCARFLSADIVDGDMIRAYHHAEDAARHAVLAGDDESAAMFGEISAAIISGKNVSGVAAQIDGFIASGEVPERLMITEAVAPVVSFSAGEDAASVAARFFGLNVLNSGEKLKNGAVLFSRSNAYAVIDEKTCIPIEGAVSLPEGDGTMTDGECIAAAKRFLSDFFPDETVSATAVANAERERGGRRMSVSFSSPALDITVTVRCDTGRVVRFVSNPK